MSTSDLRPLADALGASDRTLRRATDLGLVRSARVSERRTTVSAAERRYLVGHWPLLSALRGTLRTEPNVGLAVLFGSVARGDDDVTSDVDVLVDQHDPHWERMLELQERLSLAAGRDVHLVRLADAKQDALFLAAIVADGRVLRDRGAQWPALRTSLAALRRRGEREFAARAASALAAARA